jgi:O-antigen/teichoic acid export membrane protein/O-antigen ligase
MGGTLFAGGTGQVILIASGVLVARSLGPEDRGYLALLALLPVVLAQVASIGLPLAATYYIVRHQDFAGRIARALAVPALIQAAAACLVHLLVLTTFLGGEPRRIHVAGLIALALIPSLLGQQYGLAILQGQQRFLAFNTFRILPAALYAAGVLVAFLVGFDSLVELMIVFVGANAAGAVLILTISARGLRGDSGAAAHPSRVEMARFGLRGFVGSMSPVESFRLDQAIVAVFLSPIALGLYVVAQAFVNLPRFAAQSVGMVTYPHVAAQGSHSAARRAMWRHFLFGLGLSAVVVAALEASVSWLIPVFFGEEFTGATRIAHILLLGALFASARRVLADGARGAGRPGLGTLAEAVSWVAMVPALFLAVPAFGVEGVALAMTVSWAFSLLVLLAALAVAGRRRASFTRPLSRVRLAVAAGRGDAYLVLIAVTASCSAALASVFLSLSTVVLVCVLLAGILLSTVARTTLRRRLPDKPRREQRRRASGGPSGSDYRLPRVLYYLGLLVIGQLTFRPLPAGSLSDWLFLGSFLLVCSLFVMRRKSVPVAIPPVVMYGFLVFLIGALASTFLSQYPLESLTIVLRLAFLTLVWFWLGTIVLEKLEHVMTAIVLWVASAALNGVGAITQLIVDPYVIPGGYSHWGRMTGFTENINDLGGVTSVALVPALMLAMKPAANRYQILLGYLPLLLVGAGLVLSGSVGGFVAACAALFLWFAALPRIPVRTVVILAVAAIGGAVLFSAQASTDSPSPLERVARVTGSSDDGQYATLRTRMEGYRLAGERIGENPFLGVGLDPESSTIGEFEVHNIVIGLWFKAGILGLAGMAIMVGVLFRLGWKSLVAAESTDEQMVALALVCALAGFVVFAMSQPVFFTRYGWVAAGLLLALRGVQIRAARGWVEETRVRPPQLLRPADSGAR